MLFRTFSANNEKCPTPFCSKERTSPFSAEQPAKRKTIQQIKTDRTLFFRKKFAPLIFTADRRTGHNESIDDRRSLTEIINADIRCEITDK